jgi:hypothetical protein
MIAHDRHASRRWTLLAYALVLLFSLEGLTNAVDKAGEEVSPTAIPNFVVYPVKTPLQRRLMGWSPEDAASARAYVGVDGMAVVNDAGVIDENALELDDIRKALAPYADSQSGVVFLNVNYNSYPARNRNAEQLLVWGLEGFGRHAGFKTARSYFTYYNDRKFDWTKKITSAKEKVADRADEDEEPLGDDLLKVYPVRTAFSAFLTSADCVVDVLVPPAEDGEQALTPTIRKGIAKYVGEAKLRGRERIAFGVKGLLEFQQKNPEKLEQLLREFEDLAKSLGFPASSVASR